MKEVRSPKRPLLYYYLIALGVILLFNMLVMPVMSMNQVLEVDYGTFVQMAEDKNLGQVEVDETENQILFTDKDQTTIYKAGMIPDPDLARLLKDSGAKYGGQIIEHELGFAHCHLHIPGAIHEQKADGAGRRKKFPLLRHGKKQRKGLCAVHQGNPLFRCGGGG